MALAWSVAALVPSMCGAPPSGAPTTGGGPAWHVPSSVSIVGDSLTWANVPAYAAALRAEHVAPAGVSGLIARSLRYGYQCRVGGRMHLRKRAINATCIREGLEEIGHFAAVGGLGDAVVVALATNEARFFTAAEWAPHLAEVRRLIGARPLYLVTAHVLGARADALMHTYNAAAAQWCSTDLACRIVDWGSAPVLAAPGMFVADGIHMTPRGTLLRAAFIAREVVRLADAPVPAPPPTDVIVVAGDGRLEVSWTPPVLGEHQPVDGYAVEVDGASCNAVGVAATTCAVEGLVDDVVYSVTVHAYFGDLVGVASPAVLAAPTASLATP